MIKLLILTICLGLLVGRLLNILIHKRPILKLFSSNKIHSKSCNNMLLIGKYFPIFNYPLNGNIYLNYLSKIDYRCLLIEMLTVIIFSTSIFSKPSNFAVVNKEFIIISGFIISSFLITLTIIDINTLTLPNYLTSLGIISGIGMTFISYLFTTNSLNSYKIIGEHLLATLLGFIIFFGIGSISKYLMKRTALGFGDAKLISMAGAWLGLNGLGIVIILSFLSSGIYALIAIFFGSLKRKEAYPMGPFISSSIFLVWLLGNEYWIKAFNYF